MKKVIILCVLSSLTSLLGAVGICSGATYYVNATAGSESYDGLAPEWDGVHGPKKTIQAGIDTSTDDDTIIVADGTYTGPDNKNLDFWGRAITLKSENGPASTIIDCEGFGRGFYFHSFESNLSIVDGFTITNGSTGIYCYDNSSPTVNNCTIMGNSAHTGGGIRCAGYCSPTITNCTITANTADWGGGIYSRLLSNPTIINCTISGNMASFVGGGICCLETSWGAIITNCTITGNTANWSGGGIYCHHSCSATVTNCTITDNTADLGGGICCYDDTSVEITNSILWTNVASNGYEIALLGTVMPSTLTIRYSDVQGGATEAYVEPGCTLGLDATNIDADPMFVSRGYWDNSTWIDGDYHIQATSWCIDKGTNDALLLPDMDFEGDPRIVDGDEDGIAIVDIGADEYCVAMEELSVALMHIWINKTEVDKDSIWIPWGSFRLAEGSPPDLSVSDVIVDVDGVKFRIPAGSFKEKFWRWLSWYEFRGYIDDVYLFMKINFEHGNWSFSAYWADGSIVDNSDGVDVMVQIGHDFGKENIKMKEETISWRKLRFIHLFYNKYWSEPQPVPG